MDPIFLDLGVIQIYWYSVMIFLGLLVGGTLVLSESKKWYIPEDFMINMFFFLIPIAFVGARLYYVLFNFDYYSSNLLSIVKVWEGGLAIHGGIIAGVLWILLYCKKYKINSVRILDIMSVGLIIGQAIGRWGNFFNKEAYGSIVSLEFLQNLHLPTFIIDGMLINGNYYHPTFLYESLWCLVGFIILLIVRRLKYIKIGQIASVYLIWYGIGRFFIEGLRTDSLMFGTLKAAQFVSISMIIIGIILILIFNRGSKLKNQYNDAYNTDAIDF